MKIKPSELKLGDVVDLGFSPWGNAIVYQITTEEVHLRRPYMHSEDFSYTGGVIVYIGHEDLRLWLGDTREVGEVVQRGKELR